jgi:hypothetical protein
VKPNYKARTRMFNERKKFTKRSEQEKKINTQACYDFNWSDEAVKHANILQRSQIYSEKSTNNPLYYTLNETVFCEVTQGNCSSWSGRSTT